jgi:hypothetical protein
MADGDGDGGFRKASSSQTERESGVDHIRWGVPVMSGVCGGGNPSLTPATAGTPVRSLPKFSDAASHDPSIAL